MLTEVRQFLGLAGYYQIFTKNYFKIAKQLTAWTPKGKKFYWEHKEVTSFQKVETYVV